MKIMQIITRSDLGGAQSVLVNLANRLCNGHEVIVVAGEGDGKLWTLIDKRIEQVSLNSLRRSLSVWDDLKTIYKLRKFYLYYKPDIIHLHSSKAGLLGRLVFPKSKIIYTVHGFDSIRLAYHKFLFLERLLQNKCKAIVGVCKYDENNLLNEGITHGVGYVYNGISSAKIENKIELPVLCNTYKRRILCVARISKQKKFDTFLEIASLLPQYAFIWIGNQEAILNLPNNVFCLGSIANASSYNHLVDLFLLPTNYEGLPMVILEAMSFAKPIVASNVGGISEIVINGKNGYVVNNDAFEFVNKIRLILEDENILSAYSINSLKMFNEKLTIDKMVNGYMKLYQS